MRSYTGFISQSSAMTACKRRASISHLRFL
jgi:hypothetical protein